MILTNSFFFSLKSKKVEKKCRCFSQNVALIDRGEKISSDLAEKI